MKPWPGRISSASFSTTRSFSRSSTAPSPTSRPPAGIHPSLAVTVATTSAGGGFRAKYTKKLRRDLLYRRVDILPALAVSFFTFKKLRKFLNI